MSESENNPEMNEDDQAQPISEELIDIGQENDAVEASPIVTAKPEYEPSEKVEEKNSKRKASTNPVTTEDVRDALVDDGGNPINPFKTNAGIIRERLGRGSLSTIQKKLRAIRDESIKRIEPISSDIPHPPANVVDVLWKLAFESASNHYLRRSDELSAGKDDLQSEVSMLKADMDPLIEEISSLEYLVEYKNSEVASTKAEMKKIEEKHANAMAEVNGALSESRTQIETLTKIIEDNIKQ